MNEPRPSRAAPAGIDPLARYDVSPAEMRQILDAERRGDVFLAWRDDLNVLQLDVIEDGAEPKTIGRREGVDLRFASDLLISSVHARLECAAGEWAVTDDGISTNGTFVNEQRVAGRQRLADHDRIRLGRTIIVFREPRSRPVLPTQVDGAQRPSEHPTPGQQRVLVALCGPLLADPPQRLPATNRQIADEVHLTIGAVKAHLSGLFEKFELEHLGQHDKRVCLAERAVGSGLVSRHDLPGST